MVVVFSKVCAGDLSLLRLSWFSLPWNLAQAADFFNFNFNFFLQKSLLNVFVSEMSKPSRLVEQEALHKSIVR